MLAGKRGRGEPLVIGGKRSTPSDEKAEKRIKTLTSCSVELHSMQIVPGKSQLIVWFFPPHGWTTKAKVVNKAGTSTLELHIRQPTFKLEDVGEITANVEDIIVLAKVDLRKKMEAKAFQVYVIPLPVPVYAEKDFVCVTAYKGRLGNMKLVQIQLKIRDSGDCDDDELSV